ncbi:hypothetical protein LJR234_000334 [Mesorhizobium amorphae]|uniref:hypothetical protein n=1 Tax=Mesorhizobium amorphae TaxID=71433 RepID=UPI003ED04A36
MRSRVYNWDGYVRGHVLASVTISDHSQARLLQSLLEQAMRERAGRPEEPTLARWYRDIEQTRRQAKDEGWAGWERPW